MFRIRAVHGLSRREHAQHSTSLTLFLLQLFVYGGALEVEVCLFLFLDFFRHVACLVLYVLILPASACNENLRANLDENPGCQGSHRHRQPRLCTAKEDRAIAVSLVAQQAPTEQSSVLVWSLEHL